MTFTARTGTNSATQLVDSVTFKITIIDPCIGAEVSINILEQPRTVDYIVGIDTDIAYYFVPF